VLPESAFPEPPKARERKVDGFALLRASKAELPEEVVAASLSKKSLRGYEAEDLAFFSALKILDLSDNRLVGVAPLAALQGLKQLYVQGNALRGALDLAPGAFAGLETLDASFNALGPETLVPLAALPRLRKLDLGGNAAVGPAFPAELPPGGFPALEDLGLASCGLSGASLGALARLPRLRALGLHGNPGVEVWPSECARPGSFADLRVLDVSSCGVAIVEHLEGAWRLPKLTQLLAWGNSGCVLRAGANFRAAGCQVVLSKPGAPRQRPNLRQFYGDKRLPPMSEDVSLGQDMGFSFLERGDIEGVFAKIQETLEDFGEEIAEEDLMEARQYAPPPSDSSSASSSGGDEGDSSEGDAGAGGPGGGGFLASLASPRKAQGGARSSPEKGGKMVGGYSTEDPTLQLAQLLGMDPRRLASHLPEAEEARLGTDATASINALKFALNHPLIQDDDDGTVPAYQKSTASAEARYAERREGAGARKTTVQRTKTIEALMDTMKARLDTLRTAVDSAKRMEEKMERAMEGKQGVGGSPAGGPGGGSAEKGEAERPERAAAAALGYA